MTVNEFRALTTACAPVLAIMPDKIKNFLYTSELADYHAQHRSSMSLLGALFNAMALMLMYIKDVLDDPDHVPPHKTEQLTCVMNELAGILPGAEKRKQEYEAQVKTVGIEYVEEDESKLLHEIADKLGIGQKFKQHLEAVKNEQQSGGSSAAEQPS